MSVRAYKAFDENMQCRSFQFEVGKTYEHDGKVLSAEAASTPVRTHLTCGATTHLIADMQWLNLAET